MFNFRILAGFGFLGCVAANLVAIFYFQKHLGLEPCPMCIFQRVAMLAASVVFLLAAIHGPRAWGRWIYAVEAATASAVGGGIAARHVWLQNLPEDQRPACGPTLDYLMDMMPLKDVVTTILKGDGNCAKIDWTLLGHSLPWWTMVAFIGFALWALAMPVLAKRKTQG